MLDCQIRDCVGMRALAFGLFLKIHVWLPGACTCACVRVRVCECVREREKETNSMKGCLRSEWFLAGGTDWFKTVLHTF